MKKLSIEQQELLQQMMQGNDLKEITPFKALEMIKKQVGNIHVFTDEMPPQQTSIELRNSGLFEIIEQAFDEYLILQKMRAEYKAYELAIGFIDCVANLFKEHDLEELEDKIVKVKKALEVIKEDFFNFEFKEEKRGTKTYYLILFNRGGYKVYLPKEKWDLLREVLL